MEIIELPADVRPASGVDEVVGGVEEHCVIEASAQETTAKATSGIESVLMAVPTTN